ncbi:MAG: hypothetical protein ACD_10C00483G0001 [uncultured bacterium]|nr:MAG: hypothetical protein ACD_10C00483G0001 [uncultured bacterium]
MHDNFNTGSDFNGDIAVGHFGDFAQQATAGNHFIALGQAGDQRFVVLGFFHLWANHQEPEDDEHQDHRQQLHEAASRVGGASGLGVSETNHRENSLNRGKQNARFYHWPEDRSWAKALAQSFNVPASIARRISAMIV